MKVEYMGKRYILSRNPWFETRFGKKPVYRRRNPWPWDGRGATLNIGQLAVNELKLEESIKERRR